MNNEVLLTTELSLPLFIKGKVRDTYELGENLLIVATDRISAFDVVLPNGIPGKGFVLNQLSAFWFNKTKNLVPNHVIKVVNNVNVLKHYLPPKSGDGLPEYLAGRSMVVKKVKRLPVECVVRGYMAGSGWEEYQKSETICGIKLPKNITLSQELPETLFTPTTKADAGHDMPMTMAQMKEMIGGGLAEKVKTTSIAIYNYAREFARRRGIIIADTKMEFGLDGDNLILIDELLTPDSSRFWEASQYKVGKSQPSYDKQPVRDWLSDSGWDKKPPAPQLPPEVVSSTSERYRQAFDRLTG